MYSLRHMALMAVTFTSSALSGPIFPRSYATTTTLTQIHLALPSSNPSFSRSFLLDTTPSVAVAAPSSTSGNSVSTALLASSIELSVLQPSRTGASIVAQNTSVTALANTTTYASGTGASIAAQNTSVPALPSSTNPPFNSSKDAISTTSTSFLRGVNIGNWLVLERWMDSTNLFSGAFSGASDQHSFDQIKGAQEALQQHWSSWFTESDVSYIASLGLNAIRIPIGFWAYNNSGTSYQTGAATYLDQAIGWARNHNLKVWVDLHGSPGSQNGFDNSGQAGSVEWQSSNNLQQSISILTQMATKYSSPSYSDVVTGLELVNEPISWGANQLSTTQQFARDAYSQVKSAASASGNPHLNIIMHDSFVPASEWASLPSDLNSTTSRDFHLDTHKYQVFDAQYKSLDADGHISAACAWGATLAAARATLPIHVGEWAAAMDVCVNPDGSTLSGSSCTQQGCQCSGDGIGSWNEGLKMQTRRFVEAQLEAFERNASGYFLWAYKGPGAWGLRNLVEGGMFPNPVSERRFEGLCGGRGSTAN